MQQSYKQLTFRGIGYNSLCRIVTYLFSAASSIVLGRCLLASDYGVASFAFIFVTFMDKFADIGIGSALIQRKELDERTLDTAFTLKFAIGCLIAVFTVILSNAVPYFMNNSDVISIVRLLALCFLFNNIYFLPNALLTREMNFKKISIVETTVYFLNSAVAIILALCGYGYWSIIVAYLLSSFFSAALMTVFRPVKIRFRIDFTVAKELVNFGGYLFLSGLFAFIISNVDNFLIGSVKGARDLGYYALAFTWGSMICLIMYSVVLRVIFPLMSRLQGEEHELRSSYLKTVEYSSYIIVLANTFLFVISREFLVNILGHGTDKWLPALASLRIICVYGIVRGLLEPIGQVMVALGETRVLFKANLIACVIEISAIYPALKYFGIEGVAWAVTISYLSQYVIFYYFLKDRLKISLLDLLNVIKPACCAALPIILVFFMLSEAYMHTLILLLVKSLVVVASYVVTLGAITNWEICQLVRQYLLDEKKARQATS